MCALYFHASLQMHLPPLHQEYKRAVPLINTGAADKSLARPGRKQATATEDFDVHIYPIYNHNLRNINTIHIYIYI